MAKEIKTLDGLESGRYLITTRNGTTHIVDLDARTSTRQGAPGREWGDEVAVVNPNAVLSGSNPKVALSFVPSTPDGSPFHFTSIKNATVGQSMRLDNAEAWRITSTIQSIEVLDES